MPIKMFPHSLWKKLIKPLALMVAAAFVLAILVPWRGLFINLTTTLLGILLTIGYVDYVLKAQEKEHWALATAVSTDVRMYESAASTGSYFLYLASFLKALVSSRALSPFRQMHVCAVLTA
ncbi:MAG: hypothetical protein ABFD52_05445 [Acidobacteriota bacterium]